MVQLIISASRRTDIPAFYSDWFFNRIADGYVLVRNPMNLHQIGRVSLSLRWLIVSYFGQKPREDDTWAGLAKGIYVLFSFHTKPYDSTVEKTYPIKKP